MIFVGWFGGLVGGGGGDVIIGEVVLGLEWLSGS